MRALEHEPIDVFLSRSAAVLREAWGDMGVMPCGVRLARAPWLWAWHSARSSGTIHFARSPRFLPRLLSWRDQLWKQLRKGINDRLDRGHRAERAVLGDKNSCVLHEALGLHWHQAALQRADWDCQANLFALGRCRLSEGSARLALQVLRLS